MAEFLLGNMSITHLGMLGILAPLYGGGALLIRECVRRVRRGWLSIFVLALAYGILEEAFLMQSLFNPNFLGKNLHLLTPAYLPDLGIGAWLTVFVLTLHTVWSIAVPIALIEAVFPERAWTSWLGRPGLAAVAVGFALTCVSMALFTVRTAPAHFVASHAQFAWSAAIVAVLIATAFSLPRVLAPRRTGRAPDPWVLGIGAFAVASAFLLVPREWGWWAVLVYLALDALSIPLILNWCGRAGWGATRKLALAGGAAMAYAIHAFFETPQIGNTGTVTRIGNLVFAVFAAGLIAVGARRARNLLSIGS